jgi:hypothetical protein
VSFVMSATPVGVEHVVTVNRPAPAQRVLFDDALQGSGVSAPRPLDKSALNAVTFRVVTATASGVPFDFCVSNVRVVR